MMHLIAELSTGGTNPDGTAGGKPQRFIYQYPEDGTEDTIKPRLVKIGANWKIIAFINEEIQRNLTLDDEGIRKAVVTFEPHLLVIDPVQAHIGSDSDLQIPGRARKLMRRLVCERTYHASFSPAGLSIAVSDFLRHSAFFTNIDFSGISLPVF
ncbi:MAG: hypothetical protein IJ242_04030 [Clostridia bacterium]|nr:hypothetical protein [Clostridia bacterium]